MSVSPAGAIAGIARSNRSNAILLERAMPAISP
jgi:hypothetical protein